MPDPQQVKLVLLGDSGAGKTTIVSQYLSGTVPDIVNPTVGAAFVRKLVAAEGQRFELLIWDTAGQEVYRGLAPMYYRSALVAIIVYDVTKQASYASVDSWLKEIKANSEEGIVILVCGNKIDLQGDRVVNAVQASEAAVQSGALYAETSAITGAGIDRMFQIALSALARQRKGGPGGDPATSTDKVGNAPPRDKQCC
jgi:Rab family protein